MRRMRRATSVSCLPRAADIAPTGTLAWHSLFRTDGDPLNETDPPLLVIARHVLEHRRPVLSENDVQAERQRRAGGFHPRLRPLQRVGREVLENQQPEARRLESAAGRFGAAQ